MPARIIITEKKCGTCRQVKPIIHFNTDIGATDGLTGVCRDCATAIRRAMIRRRNAVLLRTEKQCARCSESKPNAAFYRQKASADGLASYCVPCCKLNKIDERRKNASTIEKPVSVLKRCPTCKTTKIAGLDFSRNRATFDGLARQCKGCDSAYMLKYPRKDKTREERAHHDTLKKQYAITLEEYKRLLKTQKGLCLICGHPPRGKRIVKLTVDHDHATGRVRGLLCSNCNAGLGLFKESVESLRSAIVYLESHQITMPLFDSQFAGQAGSAPPRF